MQLRWTSADLLPLSSWSSAAGAKLHMADDEHPVDTHLIILMTGTLFYVLLLPHGRYHEKFGSRHPSSKCDPVDDTPRSHTLLEGPARKVLRCITLGCCTFSVTSSTIMQRSISHANNRMHYPAVSYQMLRATWTSGLHDTGPR